MAYTQQTLSGSTNGRPIAVAATGSPGTTIHTAIAGTAQTDEVNLTASNVTASDATLTLEWGGTGTSDQKKILVPANTQIPIPAGLLNNTLLVRAFAAGAANAINIDGSVNRGP